MHLLFNSACFGTSTTSTANVYIDGVECHGSMCSFWLLLQWLHESTVKDTLALYCAVMIQEATGRLPCSRDILAIDPNDTVNHVQRRTSQSASLRGFRHAS